jgi:hypothetical protein
MLGHLIDDILFEVLAFSERNFVATLGLLRVSKLDQKSFYQNFTFWLLVPAFLSSLTDLQCHHTIGTRFTQCRLSVTSILG